MERINLNNYEAFFLDHLEGNLSVNDEQALYAFLNEHPSLQEEFTGLTGLTFADLTLSAESLESISKESLKADPNILSVMTVDQWMVDSIENNLSKSQNLTLLNYVSKHKLEDKFMAYQSTILSPNANEAYGDKSNLKRKNTTVIPLWMKIGSAAAAIVLLIFFINPSGQEENQFVQENPTLIESTSELNLARQFYTSNPRQLELKESSINDKLFIAQDENQLIVKEEQEFKIDSAVANPLIDDDLVEEKLIDSADLKIKTPELEPDLNIAIHEEKKIIHTIEEEPYKIITKAASNVSNRKVSFTRTLNTESDEYIAYHFKIGKFEFDRKKSSK